jgi:hypothetical protein
MHENHSYERERDIPPVIYLGLRHFIWYEAATSSIQPERRAFICPPCQAALLLRNIQTWGRNMRLWDGASIADKLEVNTHILIAKSSKVIFCV